MRQQNLFSHSVSWNSIQFNLRAVNALLKRLLCLVSTRTLSVIHSLTTGRRNMSNFLVHLKISPDVKHSHTLPPHPTGHREFGYWADLNLASKIENPPTPPLHPTGHREFEFLADLDSASKVGNPPYPLSHPGPGRVKSFCVVPERQHLSSRFVQIWIRLSVAKQTSRVKFTLGL